MTSELFGLVLSGGLSTRMGMDKGELVYHGLPQREYLFQLLTKLTTNCFSSCNSDQASQLDTFSTIIDLQSQAGPIGGILSAFQKNRNVAWLVVACDLPFLDASTIQYLIDHRNPLKMATVFWNGEKKFPEPLVSIWEPASFPIISASVAKGIDSPRKILMEMDVEFLEITDPDAFKNVNSLKEYETAIRKI